MNFTELAFRRLDWSARETREYITWAVELLEDGCDASSVAELASYSLDAEPDPAQVERAFQACVVELALVLPSQDKWYEALIAYAVQLCRRVVQGDLEPDECMSEFLQISEDYNDPYLTWIWVDLAADLRKVRSPRIDSGRIAFNLGLDLKREDECIRKTAIQFIELFSHTLPDKFPWIWWCKNCSATSERDTWTAASACHCPSCGAPASMLNMRFFESREQFASRAARI